MNRPRGLYAITPPVPVRGPSLAIQVGQAIRGGARMIQYREKSGNAEKRLREATELLAVCKAAGIPLIINDDLDLAARLGTAGVHLGRNDADPVTARRRLGPNAIIGVSCYNRYERAQRAQEAGADYAAFGRFFPSATKPNAVHASPELLRRARRELALPLVAIGGVTAENGRSLIDAGADMLAVVDAVFAQPDIRSAAERFTRLFIQGGCSP